LSQIGKRLSGEDKKEAVILKNIPFAGIVFRIRKDTEKNAHILLVGCFSLIAERV
jgi:hypothetical protein